jgi:hypothetical protein
MLNNPLITALNHISQETETPLQLELERCGWNAADRHFANACASATRFDGTYEREMEQFKRISETWQQREAAVEPNKRAAQDHG